MEEDQDIIEQIQKGKSEYYRILVRRYTQSVRFFLAKRLSDHHEIEDLTQEVFVAAYHALGNYDSHKKHFNGWLLSIAHNKLMSHLRKHYATLKRDAVLENQVSQLEEEMPLPEELIEKMKHCLSKLPANAQELVKSRYFSIESVIRLAERLGTSENAISSKLFRIRKNLKTCIETVHEK